MARPLRIEYPGALYHITSRGDGRDDIYLSSDDRDMFLTILGTVCERYAWCCYAYCLMDNHYHLLIGTPLSNLSKGMRHLNGVYTQRFNKAHHRVGHVFQGRYKSILVEKESYFLELSRYIVLNPVRAKMVAHANDWPWSSYQSMVGISESPSWLKTDSILSFFESNNIKSQKTFIEFIDCGINKTSPWKNLRNQIYLGTEEFVNQAISHIGELSELTEIPKIQYIPENMKLPLSTYKQQYINRNEAIYQAYASGNYTLLQIGNFFELHYSRISRIINSYKMAKGET